MDELGKVKRVVERQAPVGEVLLALMRPLGKTVSPRRGSSLKWST